MLFLSLPQNHQFPSPDQAIRQSQFHEVDSSFDAIERQIKAEFARIDLHAPLNHQLARNIVHVYAYAACLRGVRRNRRLPTRRIGRDGYPRHWKIRIRNGNRIQRAGIFEDAHPVAAAFGLLIGDVVAAVGIDCAVKWTEQQGMDRMAERAVDLAGVGDAPMLRDF